MEKELEGDNPVFRVEIAGVISAISYKRAIFFTVER
jgi:hypothetical protein